MLSIFSICGPELTKFDVAAKSLNESSKKNADDEGTGICLRRINAIRIIRDILVTPNVEPYNVC